MTMLYTGRQSGGIFKSIFLTICFFVQHLSIRRRSSSTSSSRLAHFRGCFPPVAHPDREHSAVRARVSNCGHRFILPGGAGLFIPKAAATSRCNGVFRALAVLNEDGARARDL
jgi:hypothetical protein